MNRADRRRKIEEISDAALNRDAAERAGFVAAACAGDEALREEVEALLAHALTADRFLEEPVAKVAANLQLRKLADTRSPGEYTDTDGRVFQPGPLDDARFAPGHVFANRFRIVSLLGSGGMGEVYRAEDLKLGQRVAVKLLTTGIAHPKPLERFRAEVRLAREIAHPNVCRVYDIGYADGWNYLAMEYVDGETLGSLLRRIGGLPREKALDFARQLCAGLAAAHDAGVLHRDLKPSNIMIDGRGRVRIMDFGLAITVSEAGIPEPIGTPAYIAPEQLAGGRVTERTDLYALGLVLFELFTGRAIFTANRFDRRQDAGDAAAIARASATEIDPAIHTMICRSLEADPDKRPASALAMAAALPGGDPLTAALAEGSLPSPDMVAAAGGKGGLRPVAACLLLGSVLVGTLFFALNVNRLTVSPSDLPKPPDVLAEHAQTLIARLGYGNPPVDSEFWFAPYSFESSEHSPSKRVTTVIASAGRAHIRFIYRQSPRYLIPQNTFHKVSETDPSFDVPGMAAVVFDAAGQLLQFRAVPEETITRTATPDWSTLFSEAGLRPRDFVQVERNWAPLVPYDSRSAWESLRAGSEPRRLVTAASLGGRPVLFAVTGADEATAATPDELSSGRTRAADTVLSAFILGLFVGAGALARHNLRLGQGDRRGARRLAAFFVYGALLWEVLRAHHVPLALEELELLFGATGWSLIWGGLAWVMYIGLEPYARRHRPSILISWTRLLSGRARDPLVGRDVLAGLIAGLAALGLIAVRTRIAGDVDLDMRFAIQALDSLRSVRHCVAVLLFIVLDALNFAVAGLVLLMLIVVVVRKTWAAACIWFVMVLPFAMVGRLPSGWELLFAVPLTMLSIVVLLRVGLLSLAVMFFFMRLFAYVPITLDPNAWYVESSAIALLLPVALSIYAFVVATTNPPAVDRLSSAV